MRAEHAVQMPLQPACFLLKQDIVINMKNGLKQHLKLNIVLIVTASTLLVYFVARVWYMNYIYAYIATLSSDNICLVDHITLDSDMNRYVSYMRERKDISYKILQLNSSTQVVSIYFSHGGQLVHPSLAYIAFDSNGLQGYGSSVALAKADIGNFSVGSNTSFLYKIDSDIKSKIIKMSDSEMVLFVKTGNSEIEKIYFVCWTQENDIVTSILVSRVDSDLSSNVREAVNEMWKWKLWGRWIR